MTKTTGRAILGILLVTATICNLLKEGFYLFPNVINVKSVEISSFNTSKL